MIVHDFALQPVKPQLGKRSRSFRSNTRRSSTAMLRSTILRAALFGCGAVRVSRSDNPGEGSASGYSFRPAIRRSYVNFDIYERPIANIATSSILFEQQTAGFGNNIRL